MYTAEPYCYLIPSWPEAPYVVIVSTVEWTYINRETPTPPILAPSLTKSFAFIQRPPNHLLVTPQTETPKIIRHSPAKNSANNKHARAHVLFVLVSHAAPSQPPLLQVRPRRRPARALPRRGGHGGGHRHVHLRGLLAVQVRPRERLRGQPQVGAHLHHHRVPHRRLQQLHGRKQRDDHRRQPGGGGCVRPVPVPRRPGQRRLRVLRARRAGAAQPGVRGRLRGVAAAGGLLRALRQQELRGPARYRHGVPQVQRQHQRRRRLPREPGRRAGRAGAGRRGGERVQDGHLRERAGGVAVPGRPRRRRLHGVLGAGGRAAQGHLRHRAGRRRAPRAVLRQVLGQRILLPTVTRLFARRRRADRGDNNRHLGRAGPHRGLHLLPQEIMLIYSGWLLEEAPILAYIMALDRTDL